MSNFPTKQNPQFCKNGCNTKIYLSDKKQKGRYLPYEIDDTLHNCPKKPQIQEQEPSADELASRPNNNIKKQQFTLEAVQKKLASIGITLDLDKLMNSK